MRHAGSLFLAGASIVIAANDNARPRGVAPEWAKLYQETEKFTCISNPSIHLDVSRVNDDYCDCPDGSDEPGTAACSYLSPLSPSTPSDLINDDDINAIIALPGFYCKNKGHQPSYLPFTNVNDGVCDYELCCDGSDEWQGLGGVKCKDRCDEIGKTWRSQNEARLKIVAAANKKRKELVADATKRRQDVENRLQGLQTEIEGSEVTISSLEKELAETEKREKGKVVRGATGAKVGKMGVLVGLAQQRTQELRDSLVRVRHERDAGKQRLQELEGILSAFKEEYNPNFNDEGVKRAVRAWEDYAARDKESEADAAHDRDLDEITKSDQDNGINWEEYTGGEETDDLDVLYKFEEYLPQALRSWVDQKLRELRVMMVENGILADLQTDGSESKAVTNARDRLNDKRNKLNDQRNDLNKQKEDLEKDYGPDDVFRALKGQCIDTDYSEYAYELCWMEKTTQKPKKGGAHTNLGTYVRMEKATFDEDLPPDGKGIGSGERIVMRYENGQQCWNGPHRSSEVILACADRAEIWRIVEAEKCVYRMEVGTPAVCEPVSGAIASNSKDEL